MRKFVPTRHHPTPDATASTAAKSRIQPPKAATIKRGEEMKLAFMHGPKPENMHLIPKDLPYVAIECPPSKVYSEEQLRQVAECDAIYVSGAFITEQVFAAAPRVKICQTGGTGFEKMDLAAATRHGVLCCNNADMNSSRVADFAMMLTVALFRNYVKTTTNMDGGMAWEAARKEGIQALEVEDKTLGIIGFGNIGHKLARRAHAFDMNIVYYDIDKNAHKDMAKQVGAKLVSRDELCRVADVISVHTPLNEQSRNILGEREFGLMKDGVFIVCTARGDLIEETALRRALESGKVARAAIDVFSVEPIRPDNPLIGAPNLFPTPHVAGRGKEGVVRSFAKCMRNIRDFIEGGVTPLNILNPEARPDLAKKAAKKKAAPKKAPLKKAAKKTAVKKTAKKTGKAAKPARKASGKKAARR
jgi:phosphoglycerate dehydrogenase-like enzyme